LLSKLLVSAIITLVFAMPWLYQIFKSGMYAKASGDNYTADLISFITPYEANHTYASIPKLGKIINYINQKFGRNIGERAYLGIAILIVFIYFAVKYIRLNKEIKWWTIVFLFYTILSFGNHLHILGEKLYLGLGNKKFEIPMPFIILNHLPIFSSVQEPVRFLREAMLAMSLVVALGYKELVKRLSLMGNKILFAILLLFTIVDYITIPFPMENAKVTGKGGYIKSLPPNSTILFIPIKYPEYSFRLGLTGILNHPYKIPGAWLGNYTTKEDAKHIHQWYNSILVNTIMALQEDLSLANFVDAETIKLCQKYLSAYKIDYIFIDKKYCNQTFLEFIKLIANNSKYKIFDDGCVFEVKKKFKDITFEDIGNLTCSYKPLPENAFKAEITIKKPIEKMRAGAKTFIPIRVKNISDTTWPSLKGPADGKYFILLSYHWIDKCGQVFENIRIRLPYDLTPGKEINLNAVVIALDKPGEYILEFDLVQEGVTWFKNKGSNTAKIKVTVE